MQRSFLIVVLLLSATLINTVFAQETPSEFSRITDSILAEEGLSYHDMEIILGAYSRDSTLLREFIRKSNRNGSPMGITYGYNALGKIKSDQQDLRMALNYYEKALAAALEAETPALRMHTMNLMGKASLMMDSVRNAFIYHSEVINLVSGMKDQGNEMTFEKAEAYFGYGEIYRHFGIYDIAITYYNTANDLFLDLNHTKCLALGYNKLGECYEALQNLDASLTFYHKSIDLNEELQSERLRLMNGTGMAHVLVHMGRAEESEAMLQPFAPGISSMPVDLQALYYTQYGWVLSKLEKYGQAEQTLTKGLQLSEAYRLTPYIYDAHVWLHDLWEARGDFKNALYHYKEAVTVRRRISDNSKFRYVFDAVSSSERQNRDLQMQMLARENDIVNLQMRRQRNTLLVGALLLVLFSLVLYVVYRQNQLNYEKKIMALEQSRLQSQMNPHFLFNSLNSIKHYIINNEPKSAVRYLNKFSKLVRRILEGSTMKEISLQDEIDTVELYMNIENIRFDETIDFKVEIDPDINPASVKIPSLILQPFLENSLWHGLSTKRGPKKVVLRITRDKPGYITISIRDNGIGREASRKIKEHRTLKSKSLGIPITEERLTYFSRLSQNEYELAIEDLYKKDGSPDGTQVVLNIPAL